MHLPIDTRVAATLSRLLPEFRNNLVANPKTPEKEAEVFIELPPPSGAEYQFVLFFEPEMQIHARLLQPNQKQFFWYMPFEEAEYRNDLEVLYKTFADTVDRLTLHKTRIVQRRGLLSHSFRLECQCDGAWQRVYGMSYLRFCFDVPIIRGRSHVYYCPSVVQAENQ